MRFEGVQMRRKIADWTSPHDYPSPNKTSATQWAFEFLRRNKKYQKDFEDYLVACERVVPGYSPFQSQYCEDSSIKLMDDERMLVFDPPRYEGESTKAWIERVGRGTRTPLGIWYARKWGLTRLFDPYTPYYYPNVRFDDSLSVTAVGSGWEGLKPELYPYHSEAIVIDYRKPLAEQLDAIKEYAQAVQKSLVAEGQIQPIKERRKRSGKTLRQYLRFLDAIDSGVSQTEIANVLSREDENGFDLSRIGKAIASAEELREVGYRYLLRTGK